MKERKPQNARGVLLIMAFLLPALAFLPAAGLAHGPTPVRVVEDFHKALANQDSAAALALLLPDATVYESGAAQSKDEYASHHLGADMAFLSSVERTVVEQINKEVENVAWVTTQTRTTGNYKNKAVDSTGVETMVLHHVKEGWRIAHIHWSSRKK